jgi:2-oxoglutarate ferredoxin oxidoreductase subunit beta
VFIHDNQVYGLTTGQASPTAKKGFVTKSTPDGVVDEPINPLALAITAGASFVARGFAGDAPGLTALMVAAVKHKGFSVVDILQPCVTFNKVNTYQWYRQRLYKLEAEGYVPDNKLKAIEKAMEWGDKIPVGVFYSEDKPTSEDHEVEITSAPFDLQELLSEFI